MSGRGWAGGVLLAAALVALFVAAGAGARTLLTVTITSKPSDPSTSSSAKLVFSADLRDATFACSLDGARATTCRSPVTYQGLSLGRHTFVVVATRGREQATARYAWTIVAAPPPPPSTAPLVVSVTGGGTVSSSPAGIACPTDCSEAYALGSHVVLSAQAHVGFAFQSWTGACTGGGGCTASIAGMTFVEARFERMGPPAALNRGDADKDGVPDARDGCGTTPRGSKLFVSGCALSDLVLNTDEVLDALDAYDMPGGYADRFGGVGLKPINRDLRKNFALIRKGAGEIEAGDVCGGAGMARKGAGGLQALVGKSKKLIGAMQAGVLKKPSGLGDADVKELEWAGLNYRQGIVEDAASEALKIQKAFGAACASLGPKVSLTGLVEKSDDASGSLLLANGTRVLLPDGHQGNDVAVGRGVRATGRRAPGGLVVAETLEALDAATFKPLAVKPCMTLLIAPVQPFGGPNPILHDPKGYKAQDVLQLQERMRVAASPEQCADAAGFRYSLAIEASAFGTPKKTIATDLDALDDPVPLDIGPSSKLWTLTVTHRRQGNNCPPGGPTPQPFARTPTAVTKSYPCPVVVLGTTTYKALVRSVSAYATAVYEKTVFDLESNAFVPTKVTGLTGVHSTLSSPVFEADGYKMVGSQSAGSHSKIVQNQLFAVWPEVWYGFPWLFPLDAIGVDHYAALVWPRVVGTRNGKPYRYAAQLPLLVTDLIPNCPASNCFYRLPWKAGDFVGTGQGNGPGFSHNGKQLFAFDFSMPDKSTIYATRGGIVGDVVESNTMNFNPCGDNNGNGIAGDAEDKLADGPSNFVRIDHPGGRYSFYAHVDTNSVIPAEGSIVKRGAPIAKIDNIGRSCGAHLHYQVSSDSTNTIYGQTVQICFEGWKFTPVFNLNFSSCFIPQTNDILVSNNN